MAWFCFIHFEQKSYISIFVHTLTSQTVGTEYRLLQEALP